MAATKTRSDASSNATSAARKATVPLLVAGGTVAGLAGGLALGGRRRRGRKHGLVKAAEALGSVAAALGSATDQVADTTGDVRQIREELEKANRRSPVEVLVDALTHRRGAHKREGG
jgi:hypothetical protein